MSSTTRGMPIGDVLYASVAQLSQESRPPRWTRAPAPAAPGRRGGAVNRKTRGSRTRRVTMGAVSRPVRRPADDRGDAELLRRVRAGERDAVDALYERFRR